MSDKVQHVLVVGHGNMGRGIAHSFAQNGLNTSVLVRDLARVKDLPAGVEAIDQPPAEAPDLIIESVTEDMPVKISLLGDLDSRYGPETILASNTSSLDLQELANTLTHPERFLGIHYMHPADILPMVEVIRVEQTSDAVLDRAVAALKVSGKDSVILNRPVIGFLINRLQHAICHEAYHLISEGIVTVEDVDRVAKRLFGPRLSVTGLIEQKDLSGLDTHARAQANIVPHLCLKPKPNPAITEKFEQGHLGIKTGIGFYDWRGRDVDAYRRKAAAKLHRVLEILAED